MDNIVSPSSQIDSMLPIWIRSPDVAISSGLSSVLEGTSVNRTTYKSENHKNFINFMSKSFESDERLGFGKDVLQNLQKYRDFDNYNDQIVKYGILAVDGSVGNEPAEYKPLNTHNDLEVLGAMPNGDALRILAGVNFEEPPKIVTALEDEVLELVDGRGFPEENGVILIDDEVILYRRREGKFLYGLERGAPGTTILPTFRSQGTYLRTEPASHYAGAVVVNLSVLFLVSILDTIHKSHAHNIDSSRVVPEINRSSLLQNIRDFFKAKGSKLGIKALFKILFGENDVDVLYPGDRMITPSKSSWDQPLIMRTVPVPDVLCPPDKKWTTPDNMMGSKIEFKSYSATVTTKNGKILVYEEDDVFALSQVDYVSSYPYLGETQYEFFVNKDIFEGDIIVNPFTNLNRKLEVGKVNDTRDLSKDNTTLTVNSTLGFPDKGIVFIDNEGIYYQNKTPNQFLDCIRGYIGVQIEHAKDSTVYGPYYIETSITDKDGETYYSRSWPLGLVKSVDIKEPGLLHTVDDQITVVGPGRIDPREQILCRVDENNNLLSTFRENYNDVLTTQATVDPNEIAFVSNRTHGPDALFFDDDYVFVSTSGFPEYTIGAFTTSPSVPFADRVGPNLLPEHTLHVFPRRHKIKLNIIEETEEGRKYVFDEKGTDIIGVFIDGVRAFSNVSPRRVTQGKIVKFNVKKQGRGYRNPTVVITPSNSTGIAVVDSNGGKISDVTPTSIGNYTDEPRVRISSGEGANLQPTLDPYGRILSVGIVDGGRYFKDVPSIVAIDNSGKGKGALFTCTVESGTITSITVVSPGIDYISDMTTITASPIGSGAEVEAVVEYYRYNRPEEIYRNTNWTFDKGNGFVYEKPIGVNKELYGYTISPTELRRSVSDNGRQHSPILGWAYDGNPIYGPYGYSNSTDDEQGVERQLSGYVRLQNRLAIVPSGGGTTIGSDIPSILEYPMGVFVEDYVYSPFDSAGLDPNPTIFGEGYLTTELDQYVTTEDDEVLETDVSTRGALGGDLEVSSYITNEDSEYITTEDDLILETDVKRSLCFPPDEGPVVPEYVLDENNGKLCNTPEFPKELYPDGIYAYFITVDEDGVTPAFPYIIGKTFNNRPISQQINVISKETISPLPRIVAYSSILVDETVLEFDFNIVERFRNENLLETKTNLKLKIDKISGGSVSNVLVIDAKPDNTKVGDLIFFNNEKTRGGGARGEVATINGVELEKSEGSQIMTRLISHRQRLDLSSNRDEDGNPVVYVFVPGTFIEAVNTTDNMISRALVRSYDRSSNVLEIQTVTVRLFKDGDQFFDNKQTLVQLPLFNSRSLNTRLYEPGENVVIPYVVQPLTRPDSSQLRAGDLWWSSLNGRLYVYYNDRDSSQWVCTQPIGMIPIGNTALDATIGTQEPDTSILPAEQNNNYVIISSSAPGGRIDGSELQYGDLWWSSHTGVMYLWNSDEIPSSITPSVAEWVCTDPSGTVPQEDTALNEVWPDITVATDPQVYESGLKVIISETAPTSYETIGGCVDLVPGLLWWSPTTGKMYIWYNDGSNFQWTITNPHGAINSIHSLNVIIGGGSGGGDGGSGGGTGDDIYGPNAKLPELEDRNLLWFESLKHFLVSDIIEFQTGAPGFDEGTETAKIQSLVSDVAAQVIRGYEDEKRPNELPDGALTVNQSRSLYTLYCTEPHQLRKNDVVFIQGSSFDEVNGEHVVIEVGVAEVAEGTANILDGQVISVDVTNPGSGYPNDFYVTFTGGGGVGALALAEVDENGVITNTTMVSGGSGYVTAPNVYFGTSYSNKIFSIYTKETYGVDNDNVTYVTTSNYATSTPSQIQMISPGQSYESLPVIEGLYKRSIDRAKTYPILEGGRIVEVEIINPGNRYISPIAIIIDRQEGRGQGANAQVNVIGGKIDSIVITNGGRDYLDPVIYLVENDGKFICDTNDIGKIQSILVQNPGRNISADRSLKPEIKITTRCVVDFEDDSIGSFIEGQMVYQGIVPNKMVTAVVESYDDINQVVTLVDVTGYLVDGEVLCNTTGTKGKVVVNGQADCRIIDDGTATPEGDFIDDTSKVSARYAVIQDSYRYQWFSYVISSPIQSVEYDTFVESIIHPAGFIRFADLTLHDSVKSGNFILEEEITFIGSVCEPKLLLDANGRPILGSTVDGINGILVQDDCIPRCETENILTSAGLNIIVSHIDGEYELMVQDLCTEPFDVLALDVIGNRYVLSFDTEESMLHLNI